MAAACTAAGARSPSAATDTTAIVSHRFTETLLSLGLLPTDQRMPACTFVVSWSAHRPQATWLSASSPSSYRPLLRAGAGFLLQRAPVGCDGRRMKKRFA